MEPELPEVPLVSVPRLPPEPLLPTDASLPVELEPDPIEPVSVPEVELVSVEPEVAPEPIEPDAEPVPVEPAVEPAPVVAEPLTPPGVVAVPVLDVSEPGIALVPAPAVPVALPVPVPVPEVPAVPALVPPVVPVAEPELPLPAPVCAVAPAAANATAERIVAASFPMLMNFLLVDGHGAHGGTVCEPAKHSAKDCAQSRARSYCGGQRTCTPSCFAAARGQ